MPQTESTLLFKINELETYIQTVYPEKKLKIHDFLDDLKTIEPNLSVIGLLNHLVEMYNEGSKLEEIIHDVQKTKKVFTLAGEYVKTLEQDTRIANLSKEIHEIILLHLERALQLYRDEYDVAV